MITKNKLKVYLEGKEKQSILDRNPICKGIMEKLYQRAGDQRKTPISQPTSVENRQNLSKLAPGKQASAFSQQVIQIDPFSRSSVLSSYQAKPKQQGNSPRHGNSQISYSTERLSALGQFANSKQQIKDLTQSLKLAREAAKAEPSKHKFDAFMKIGKCQQLPSLQANPILQKLKDSPRVSSSIGQQRVNNLDSFSVALSKNSRNSAKHTLRSHHTSASRSAKFTNKKLSAQLDSKPKIEKVSNVNLFVKNVYASIGKPYSTNIKSQFAPATNSKFTGQISGIKIANPQHPRGNEKGQVERSEGGLPLKTIPLTTGFSFDLEEDLENPVGPESVPRQPYRKYMTGASNQGTDSELPPKYIAPVVMSADSLPTESPKNFIVKTKKKNEDTPRVNNDRTPKDKPQSQITVIPAAEKEKTSPAAQQLANNSKAPVETPKPLALMGLDEDDDHPPVKPTEKKVESVARHTTKPSFSLMMIGAEEGSTDKEPHPPNNAEVDVPNTGKSNPLVDSPNSKEQDKVSSLFESPVRGPPKPVDKVHGTPMPTANTAEPAVGRRANRAKQLDSGFGGHTKAISAAPDFIPDGLKFGDKANSADVGKAIEIGRRSGAGGMAGFFSNYLENKFDVSEFEKQDKKPQGWFDNEDKDSDEANLSASFGKIDLTRWSRT